MIDVLELHQELRNSEILLASQLKTDTNGLDVFHFKASVTSLSTSLLQLQQTTTNS